MHIEAQAGRFDNPNRLFWSVAAAWRSVISQLNDYRELLPEFFFEPDAFVNPNGFDLGMIDHHSIANVELPPWAGSPMEMVYLNRKALESSFVSARLHLWIDLIFGYKQRGEAAVAAHNVYKEEMYDDIWEKEPEATIYRRREIESIIDQVGQVPPQLFIGPHETRNTLTPTTVLEQTAIVTMPMDGCAFGLFSNERDELMILGSMCEFLMIHLDFNPQRSASSKSSSQLEVRFEKLPRRSQFPTGLTHFVRLSDTGFAALHNEELECILIDSENTINVPGVQERITALSSAEGLLSVSSADARTHIFELSSGRLSLRFSVPSYRAAILCSCLSRQFGVFVTGTDDRVLIVGRLADGSTVRVIQLQFVPHKVLVTPHWGFIVVHGCEYFQGRPEHTLCVFNINGTLIRSVPFRSAIDDWLAWSDEKGFDFIALSTERGKIYAFEVFFLDCGSPIYRCSCNLVSLDFSKKSNVIVAVATDGRVHIIPFLTRSIEKYSA
jgi:hypothetical protein